MGRTARTHVDAMKLQTLMRMTVQFHPRKCQSETADSNAHDCAWAPAV